MDAYHYTCVQIHRMSNSNGDYGSRTMMMHLCKFIRSNKCVTLNWEFDGGGDCTYTGTVGIWESLYLLFNFAGNLKPL